MSARPCLAPLRPTQSTWYCEGVLGRAPALRKLCHLESGSDEMGSGQIGGAEFEGHRETGGGSSKLIGFWGVVAVNTLYIYLYIIINIITYCIPGDSEAVVTGKNAIAKNTSFGVSEVSWGQVGVGQSQPEKSPRTNQQILRKPGSSRVKQPQRERNRTQRTLPPTSSLKWIALG